MFWTAIATERLSACHNTQCLYHHHLHHHHPPCIVLTLLHTGSIYDSIYVIYVPVAYKRDRKTHCKNCDYYCIQIGYSIAEKKVVEGNGKP